MSGAVGGSDHQHVGAGLNPVHLVQQRREHALLDSVALPGTGRPLADQCVNLETKERKRKKKKKEEKRKVFLLFFFIFFFYFFLFWKGGRRCHLVEEEDGGCCEARLAKGVADVALGITDVRRADLRPVDRQKRRCRRRCRSAHLPQASNKEMNEERKKEKEEKTRIRSIKQARHLLGPRVSQKGYSGALKTQGSWNK
jgi:hypothetical protein